MKFWDRTSHALWRDALLVTALLTVFVVQGVFSIRRNSLTIDEPCYLLSGAFYLHQRTYTANAAHPPLMKYLFVLPLWLDAQEREGQRPWMQGVAAEKTPMRVITLFGVDAGDLFRRSPHLVHWARGVTLALGALLLLGIYFWGRQAFGPAAGLLSLALAAFNPELLAHGSLATLDLPVTVFVFLSVYFHWLRSRGGGLWTLLLCFALAAFAVSTKFSGLLLFPIFLLLLARSAWKREGRLLPGLPPTAELGVLTLGWIAVTLFVLNLCYCFGGTGLELAQYPEVMRHLPPTWKGWAGRAPVPLPRFVIPAFSQLWHRVNQGQTVRLLGQTRDHGLWYYYIYSLFAKTPLPTLFLFLVTAAVSVVTEAFLLLPVLIIFVFFSVKHDLAIGLRYVLPAIPFLLVLAGKASLWARRYPRWGMAGLALLVAFNAVSVLSVSSNYLAYFNELSEGRKDPSSYLCDVNFDWGQNMLRLRRLLGEKKISDVAFLADDFYIFGGFVDPHAYGIGYRRVSSWTPGDGMLAVSACTLAKLPAGELRHLVKIGDVEGAIFLFSPERPAEGKALLPRTIALKRQ